MKNLIAKLVVGIIGVLGGIFIERGVKGIGDDIKDLRKTEKEDESKALTDLAATETAEAETVEAEEVKK